MVLKRAINGEPKEPSDIDKLTSSFKSIDRPAGPAHLPSSCTLDPLLLHILLNKRMVKDEVQEAFFSSV